MGDQFQWMQIEMKQKLVGMIGSCVGNSLNFLRKQYSCSPVLKDFLEQTILHGAQSFIQPMNDVARQCGQRCPVHLPTVHPLNAVEKERIQKKVRRV